MKSMAELEYHYGLKVRIYPSPQQKRIIKLNSSCYRTFYNKLVEMNQKLYFLKQVKGVYIQQVAEEIATLEKRLHSLAEFKNHYLYFYDKDIDSLIIANARNNYQKAWNNFKKVKKARPPKFKKKHYSYSYQTTCMHSKMTPFTGSIKFLDLDHIRLPKVGRIRVSGSHKTLFQHKQDIRIGTVTISCSASGKYYASFALASDTPFVQPKPKTGKQLGVDLNIENFLTDSNGAMVENPRYYEKSLHKLKRAQRVLSRRQRRAKANKVPLRQAKNYQKQRKLVAILHETVANRRTNFINNLTTALINSHDLVVAEKLMSSNMVRNHHLAQRISDVGWREFLTKMTYKSNLYGKKFIMVNPKNTTQTCSNCGLIMGHDQDTVKLKLKDREWTCPACGTYHIRDWNAAKNILTKGLVTLA